MKRLTIYDIKRAVEERGSNFFAKDVLKSCGQTMKSFKVTKINDVQYLITAPKYTRDMVVGRTEYLYNSVTNKLFPQI